ncbi:unnamed protein product [Rotaria sordida]|uniref:Uncharacterized protein n=1 Tax=Rotaria sordida TaxID=392033 RepID=A0A815X9L1_9BILA|nr:unnamed protein product [Rotaria sordida]CAF1554693.1 unnamed protein product [Rotaria sordida]
MTANDHGHVNNLDAAQMETLKRYWIALINAISTQSSLPVDQIINSVYGDEFFHAVGYENPDVLTLRWLRISSLIINTTKNKKQNLAENIVELVFT